MASDNNVPGESASHENHQGRRVKRKTVGDAPSSVEDKADVKRLRGVDQPGNGAIADGGHSTQTSALINADDVTNKRKQASEFVKMLMKAVNAAKDDTGRLMSTEFKHLPDQQLFADYYEIIRSPVSLEVIRQKNSHFDKFIKQYDKTKDPEAKESLVSQPYEGYADWRAAEHDFDMIWRNAKRYNLKGALIYEDAQKLHKLTKTLSEEFAKKLSGEEVQGDDIAQPSNIAAVSAKPSTTIHKQIRQGMKTIEGAKSLKGNRSATEFFHELPDRNEYADYYDFIQKPISLAEINEKLQQKAYNDLNQWKEDVTLMCDNAMQYNIEGSTVYEDAVAIKNELQKFLHAHQDSSQHGLSDPSGTTSTSVPLAGSFVPKIKLNISGLKEARPSSQASRPFKEKQEKPARQKKPALPEKVITKEIVTSLPQYDEAEKTTWAATLNAKQTKQLLQFIKEETTGAKSTEQATSEKNPPATVKPSLPIPTPAASEPVVSAAHPSVPDKVVKPNSPALAAQPDQASATQSSASTAIPVNLHAPPQAIVAPPQQTTFVQPSKEKPAALPQRLDDSHKESSHAEVTTIPAPSEEMNESAARPSPSLYTSFSIPAPIPLPKTVPLIYVPKRPPPQLPLIRHLHFLYDLTARRSDTPVQPEYQNTLRLRNMRGITSHIVAITTDTRNIEITAFLEEGYYNLNPLSLNSLAEPVGHVEGVPIAETLSYAPLPELSLQCNGKTPKGELVHPGGDVTKRPVAHKWSFLVDPGIANFVVEIYAHRPAEKIEGGRKEVKETCMIFVNRQ